MSSKIGNKLCFITRTCRYWTPKYMCMSVEDLIKIGTSLIKSRK